MTAAKHVVFRVNYVAWLPRAMRDLTGLELKCEKCDEFAAQAKATEKELEKYDCGRPYPCCSMTFACPNGHRTTIKLDAPEYA